MPRLSPPIILLSEKFILGATKINNERFNRKQLQTLELITATAVLLYVCYLLALPFLPALAWALALAVVALPIHRRIERLVKNTNLAAGLSVFLVAVVVVAPIVFTVRQITGEAVRSTQTVRQEIESGNWRVRLEQYPQAASVVRRLEEEANLRGAAEQAVNKIPALISDFLSGSIWLGAEFLITFFALFFFFRDRQEFLRGIRHLVPLSDEETDEIFKRVNDTLYATLYGVVAVAAAQGTLAGLMFWLLGLPAPVLWGLVMSVLALLPFLGTWLIWIPAAVYLALEGSWVKSLILLGWGLSAVALIDNFLYPIIVGNRLRLHTLIIFISLVGGVGLFGAAGIVLGPLTLALTVALLDIWRSRTATRTGKIATEG